MALFLFQVVFMETAGYIIIGAIAERISFAGFLLAEVAMGAVIYPIYGMWVWGGGWMAHLGTSLHLGHGAVDFAGSGVVHGTGGWAALALAMVLGPRIGKFNDDGAPTRSRATTSRFVVIGTLVLVFGWMGFNPGSTLGATDLRIGIVAVNTLLAACVGFVIAMVITNVKYGKPDISMSCNGMLAGLVAITAGCAFVAPWAAAVIGGVAGALVVYSVEFFDAPHRRSVRRDLGARRERRVGRALRRVVRRRHVRRGLERRQPASVQGPVLRRRRPAVGADRPRARRLRVGVGYHVDHLHGGQALHPDPRVARGRDPRPRRSGVRRALLPRLRAAPRTSAGHSLGAAVDVPAVAPRGNGSEES